jgi:hypothetical protein
MGYNAPMTRDDKSPDKGEPAPDEMLTDSERQSLRQEAKETSAFAQKAFAHLRPRVLTDDLPKH